ncbi:MAG: tyrosine-protein phosphatase [Bacteroidales bacterium]|nr:tyrosine-protein phosphatase [Bacteroidales bacterium]
MFGLFVILSIICFVPFCKPAEAPAQEQQEEETPNPDDGNNSEEGGDTGEDTPEPPQAVHSPDGSVENDIVYAYVNAGEYEKFGEKSFFSSDPVVKATADLYKWKADDPKETVISWEGDASSEYTVSISKPEGLWYEETVKGTSYSITNLIPGVTYSYTVSLSGSPVKADSFTPTGKIRMVNIPCSWNYRDHGGWTGLEGKSIKYGWIYRGGCLCGVFTGTDGTDDPYSKDFYEVPDSMSTAIKRIGIKAELDLRDYPKQTGVWGDEHSAHGISLMETRFEGVDFMQIMTDYALYYPFQRSAFVQDMAWIIYEVRKGCPVAYHCRSGADRTGGLGLLIGGLLGMSQSDLQKDYELTSISTEKKEKKLKLANNISSSYQFLSTKKGIFTVEGDTFQEKCYRYLNQQFEDVRINADDLDWFIKFMLGLDNYTHPSWAQNYDNNALEDVFGKKDGSALDTDPTK